MSEALEIVHRYKLIRDRLQRPPNAIKDKPIDLKPPRIPPSSPSVRALQAVLDSYRPCKVTIRPIMVPKIGPLVPKKVGFPAILRAVCSHFVISIRELKGPSRRGREVLPRHIVYYLASMHTGLSTPQIGHKMGGRDHTTIMHGRNKIKELLLVDEDLANTVRIIEYAVFAGYYDGENDIARFAVPALNM